jgi:hypothetical protein
MLSAPALQRDAVDAATDAEVLAGVLNRREIEIGHQSYESKTTCSYTDSRH